MKHKKQSGAWHPPSTMWSPTEELPEPPPLDEEEEPLEDPEEDEEPEELLEEELDEIELPEGGGGMLTLDE